MDLSIIIVSWNVRDLLHSCLDSIYKNTRGISFEVFVIDNGSTDKTVEMIQTHFKDALLIANATNRGFAGANNQGIQKARGTYILLLNPDTKIKGNALTTMVEFMDNNGSIGISGCHLLNTDGSHQNSVRRFPQFLDQVLILLKGAHLIPNAAPLKNYLYKDFDYTREQIVDQVMGAFFMVRAKLFNKIGLLDEKRFFNWFEEVDFCKRAKAVGSEIWYTPRAEIIHHFGQSFQQMMSIEKQKMWNRSVRNYFLKHHSMLAWIGITLASWIALIPTAGRSILLQHTQE